MNAAGYWLEGEEYGIRPSIRPAISTCGCREEKRARLAIRDDGLALPIAKGTGAVSWRMSGEHDNAIADTDTVALVQNEEWVDLGFAETRA